ncbi:uncharacterized protein LOC129594975 isoform X2 [Paramacrobiotus metropolitanus]|uniref:uncharacterized protein LOC129594975 isoform X2 n=1 Tax=Paramacrobiotus metropolitanus TaxID=2943436 RepID=UPI0024456C6E|nr:uncharacterized protein LOC129594975 isoform X2 [Paramacrobiotus metropolitanus]
MEKSELANSSFYLLLMPAANTMEPNVDPHLPPRSASPAVGAAVDAQQASSTSAAKYSEPAATASLGVGRKRKRGHHSVNNENSPSNGGCVHCLRDVLEEPCPLHSHSVPDTEVLPLALATLPSSLSFLRATPDALPCGVRTQSNLPARTVFGPMRGVMCPHAKRRPPFFGIPDGSALHGMQYFHTESLNGCNWMLFVQLAFNSAEHNLTAYTVDGQVYFATTRDIMAGEELKIRYSASYAKAMSVTGCLREISNVQPVRRETARDRNFTNTAQLESYCEGLGGKSGLPESFPLDSDIMMTDGFPCLPVVPSSCTLQEEERENDDAGNMSTANQPTLASDAEEAVNDSDEEELERSSVGGDASQASPVAETSGDSMPTALLDAGEGDEADTNAVSHTVRRKKRKRPPRFRPETCNPEAVARLEAIIQVNPYQYGPGKQRHAALDAVVDLLNETSAGNTRSSLKSFIRDCLLTAPEAVEHFSDTAEPEMQRYLVLVKTLTDLRKGKVMDWRREGAVAQLEAVVKFNPFQYDLLAPRMKAFVAALQSYTTKPLSPAKLKHEARKLEIRVKRRIDHLPKLMKQYNPTTAQDSLKEYVTVLEKLVELRNSGAKTVRRSVKVSNKVRLRTKPATEGVYACTGCMFSFESAELLALHTRGHDAAAVEEGGGTTCPGCQEECGSMTALIAHVEKHRKAYRPRRQCPHCGLYVSVNFFDRHVRTTHPEKSEDPTAKFACGTCQKEFVTQKQLWSHEMLQHRTKHCLFCAQVFPNYIQLGEHVAQHQLPEGFLCPHCPKTYDSYTVLTRHHRRLHNPKAVCVCSVCGVIKLNRDALRSHMVSHGVTARQHPCPLCGKTFPTNARLQCHRDQVHSGAPRKRRAKKVN